MAQRRLKWTHQVKSQMRIEVKQICKDASKALSTIVKAFSEDTPQTEIDKIRNTIRHYTAALARAESILLTLQGDKKIGS